MGVLGKPIDGGLRGGGDEQRSSIGPVPAASTPAAPAPVPIPRLDGSSDLSRRRDALAEQVTELHWDLGGLAYEMAIRDHFRLDVLVRRAAVLQERDAELAELERLLRMEQDGVAGSCPHCSAPHSRGALFCWQCGATLMERRQSNAAGQQGATTAVMDTLSADYGARRTRSAPDEAE
jgi:hypothetical protein